MREKVPRTTGDRDVREVNVGSSKTQDKSETEGRLVKQMDIFVHKRTDGKAFVSGLAKVGPVGQSWPAWRANK